jgi:DNA-binding NarL/FixJ family response regulator
MSEAKETSVIILAKTALHRAAWEALLAQQPAIAVWGSAAELEDIPPLQSPTHNTAVLVDFPALSIDWLQKLGTAVPGHAILCLVDEYNLQQIVSLLQAGIGGCLLREAAVPDLIRALIAVSRGEIVLPPALAAQALAALARGTLTQDTAAESLTEREKDVLHLLARGKTNKDIAQTLFLSVRTIEAHLHNIYSKLNVNSRTEAVLWAVQQQDSQSDL